MIWLLAIPASYQLLAFFACLRFLFRPKPSRTHIRPFVSVLKPVYRPGPRTEAALKSNRHQNYSAFEVLAQSEEQTRLPNRKVGKLVDLARRAHGEILVWSDADITVAPDYLATLVDELSIPQVGLVTCLYRASAGSIPGRWEALGIATDFVPSALTAPLTGVREFGLGSTLAFHRQMLNGIDLIDLGSYIADDYQMGARIARSGQRVWISSAIVETHLDSPTWSGVWKHQVRWARTIRLSRGAYAGLPVTNATVWALLAAMAGAWSWAAGLLLLRLVTGLTAGLAVVRCPVTARWWWLMPLRDLWGFAIWLAGMTGRSVEWGGRTLHLDGEGRILKEDPIA